MTCKFINIDEPSIIATNPYNILSVFAFDYCNNNPVMYVDKDGYIGVSSVVKTVINAISGYFVGKAIADYFKLTGWKRKLCIGATSGLMVVLGWFSPVSIYNAIKSAISLSASAFLSSKGYTISRDLFNHSIYGYGKEPSNKIKNALIAKLKKNIFYKKCCI